MSKKNGFGKFVLFCIAVAAVAAGVYYYLSKKDKALADEFDDDDFDDFEDYEDDEESSTSDFKFGSRKYVDIKSSDSSDKESNSKSEKKSEEKDSEEKKPESSEEFFDDED